MDDVRLIDANALAEEFVGGECMKSMAEAIADKRFVKAIRQAPTIDAVPVVHGRWVKPHGMMPPEYHHRHVCSVCHEYALHEFSGRELWSYYCPNCGAKMDAKEAEHGQES